MSQKQLSLGKQITLLSIAIGVLVFLCSVTFAIVNIRASLLEASQVKVKEVVELAYNTALGYKQKADSGEYSQEQAQKLALHALKNFRYQGKNYVWVNDYDNKFLVHPSQPVGSSIDSISDKNGKHFFTELSDSAKAGKEEYVSYFWTKQGQPQDKVFPKTSISIAFPEWKWVIATGVYVDEIDQKVMELFWQIFLTNLLAVAVIVLVVQLTFVKRITGDMNAITDDLANSSGQILEASHHLDDASHKLAEGSSEQAASIQEVSATLEETSSMVQRTNENTNQAAIMARKAKENANKSHSEMARMMQSMENIKSSSNEISKIIKVIDEIAFQTNILALNAAVEAARAGDAGKGFAVVAEEVRNLAQRSTQSARETTDLIENNIGLSEEGVDIAKSVYDAVDGIDTEAKKVSELLDDISAATKEQSIGIEQIHKAVSQMEQVMHSSVQAADGTASASQELFAQTSSMNDIVDRVSLIVNGESLSRKHLGHNARIAKPKNAGYDARLLSDDLSDY